MTTDEQREALMRIGWSRGVPRWRENELAALGLIDTHTGWFTDHGKKLFDQWKTGDWVHDINMFGTQEP